ncbi:MAG: FAD-binding protein [Thermoproteota archaeon]|jgi:electron transfer flavoprotein alpha subunit
MHIVVCIKQVPDSTDMRIDPKTNNLIREGVPSVTNPPDLHATEEALKIKEKFGGIVSVVTMGPLQAESSLREILAMGADYAYHVSDRALAGSDTLATSYTLWMAIKKICEIHGPFTFIFFGRQAIDGETGQTGLGVAARFGIPIITYTYSIDEINLEKGYVIATRKVYDGKEIVKATIPTAFSIIEEANKPRIPSIKDIIKAYKAKVIKWNKDDLKLEPDKIGLRGSPTFVKKVFPPPLRKKGQIFDGRGKEKEAVVWLIDNLLKINAFGEKIAEKYEEVKPLPIAFDKTKQFGEVWSYVEHRYGKANPVSWELLGESRRLSRLLNVKCATVVIGYKVEHLIEESASYGADKIYYIDDKIYEDYRTEPYSYALTELCLKYKPDILLMPGTQNGRDLAGYAATLISTGLVADVTQLDIDPTTGILLATRPDYGGNEMSTIICPKHKPQMCTIRPKVFKIPPKIQNNNYEIIKEDIKVPEEKIHTELLKFIPREKIRLEEANVIVSVGKGFGSPKNLYLAKEFAKIINAEIGTTRAVVYSGWLPKEAQIGQTGLTVRPRLYFAIGISGAIQHVVGMQGSDIIVAINIDPEAPIFNVADFGIIGDLFKILPLLTEELKNRIKTL